MVKRRSLSSLYFSLAARQNRKGWASSLAVISIGAIAITLFCGFLANAASLDERIQTMINASNAPEIYLTTDPRDGYDLSEVDKLVQNVDNIASVEERFTTYCTLSSHNALATIEPNKPVYSRPYQIVETSEEESETHYFMVDSSLTKPKAEALGTDSLYVGGNATISIPLASFSLDESVISALDLLLKPGKTNPFRANNLELNFTITSSFKHMESSAKGTFNPTLFLCSSSYFRDVLRATLSSSFSNLGVEAIWKIGLQNELGWGDGDPYGSTANFPLANQYLLRLKDAGKTEETKAAISSYYAGKKVNNLYTLQTVNELTAIKALEIEKTQAWQLTFVFPVVFFAVALLVSLISVRQMILHERVDIGTYKALGVTKGEIHRHYALKTLTLAGIGTFIGEIVGPFLVPSILGNKYNILYSLPERSFSFPWLPCLATAAIYLGVTAFVTFMVSHREIKRKPVESMRPEPPEKRSKKVTRFKESSWLQLSLKMAGRSVISDKVKAGMVVIGVLGCTALLCCGYGIEDTIRYGVDTDPLIVSGADVTAFMIEEQSLSSLHDSLQIKDENGNFAIASYQPFSRESINVQSQSTTYYTTVHFLGDATGLSSSPVEHFTYSCPIDQVLVSEKIARALNVSKGDEVSFVFHDIEVKATIFQTIPIFYENGLFLSASSPLLSGTISGFNAVWVDAVDGEEERVENAIRAIPTVGVCNSETSWRKAIEEAMGSILVMTNAIKFFAFLLAAVVLYDLGMLNFNEKQREIATMKVLGFKQMEIMNSIIIETMFLSLIGIIAGLAIGYPFTVLVLYINQVELVDFLYTVEPLSYIIAFSFTFVLSLIINLLLSLRIRKVMAVESLKSVE